MTKKPQPRSLAHRSGAGPKDPQEKKPPVRETLYGLRAIRAVWVRRPQAIQKLGYAPELAESLEDLLAWARSAGVVAKPLGPRELEQAARTQNHEGLVAEVAERAWVSIAQLADALVDQNGAALALDRVRNPYNVGAILRSAAFFGLSGVVLGAPAPHPALAPDAVRVAEGGAEDLLLSRTTDLAPSLARLRARGIHVVGAESDGAVSLEGFSFPRPCVVVVGHEREGLSERVRATCEHLVSLPGGGLVGSLNVAVTSGIFAAALSSSASSFRGVRPR